MKGYYFITDAGLSKAGVLADVRNAVAAGCRLIQYRNKTASTKILYEEALEISAACRGTDSLFIVNDRLDIALAADADGVHLGQDDLPYPIARRLLGPGKVIGITVHNYEEAIRAAHAGADYLAVSPLFPTGTKADAGKACGLETLKAVRRVCTLPLVAIGGITLANATEVIQAGADLLCAISAVVTHDDVASEIMKFQAKFTLQLAEHR